MKNQLKTVLAAMLIAGTTAVCPLVSTAATVNFSLDTLYNGASPGTSTPWLTASITDKSPNTVLLTLTANNLSAGEYVSSWYFNLATNLNASSLNIVKTNLGSGTVNGTISKGNNSLASGGAGNFDFGFNFYSGSFTAGESVVFVISGISGLSASSFNFLSQGGAFYTAAVIAGISTPSRTCGTSTTSGKVGDNTPSPAPEPATVAILGSFVALGAYLKRRKDNSVTVNQ